MLPRNPLDVLAQQLVAMTIGERFTVDELLEIVRRAAPFETLTREVLEGVLGMLAGRLPERRVRRAQAARRLGPADRHGRRAAGRARRRRHQRRHDPRPRPVPGLPRGRARDAGPAGRRARRGDGLRAAGRHARRRRGPRRQLAGASPRSAPTGSPSRPRPGVPGKLPFWKGDAVGRPIELGRAMGAFTREAEADLERGPERAGQGRRSDCSATTTSTPLAAENLLAYLEDERGATGVLPTDRRIVVERFRDELGDWRLVILTPFGGRVHAPWTMALEARLQERLGLEVQTIWSDDGIAIRLPEGEASLDGVEALLFPEPEEVEDLVVGRVGQSSLFASRFRENAARALLLPAAPTRHADPAVAAAPAGGGPAGGRVEVRQLPDPRRDLPRVPRRRVRPRRPARDPRRGPPPRDRRPQRRDAEGVGLRELAAVRLHRRSTCTRATRRWPSAGRRR